ncbi:hypothetical protein [Celeribacter indicus]|uniref:Uncharacterized protein n=1 Tax=Celeribacter indicus TaxID=1208324 RepID=A0A0B5DMA7_9RHOB|nr:hypothetical protein [Celeribacter indicus]AJE44783.1 hypothetical protein P73_0068 [Celeribacter indicus]
MVHRIFGALARAALVVLLIITPSLMLPEVSADTAQVVALVAVFGAALAFFEYVSAYPGLIEFRDAPPFNRLRFGSLLITVFLLSLIMRGFTYPSVASVLVTAIGGLIGYVLDFPGSPVRLMIQALPHTATLRDFELMRIAAGMSYLISLVSLCFFLIALRVGYWPARNGSFNVWINLPTFDPTAGGDVVARLKRDARINILIGFLLPFVIPAVLHSASDLFGALDVTSVQSLIWTVAAWAFLPSSLFMRGIAMGRVATMIEMKRRETYARADLDHLPA